MNYLYMPMLKWKEGEINALHSLTPEQRSNIYPYISLVPKYKPLKNKEGKKVLTPLRREDALEVQLQDIASQFKGDIPRIAVDCSLLFTSDRSIAISSIQAQRTLISNHIVPVLVNSDLNDSTCTTEILKELQANGFCFKVTIEEYYEGIWNDLNKFLYQNHIQENLIDVVFDLGQIQIQQVEDNEYIDGIITKIPNSQSKENWRSFYLASGAAPVDLRDFKTDERGVVIRADYILWKIISKKCNFEVGYADYTIRHPIYRDIFGAKTTMSARYTSGDNIFVYKGLSRQKYEEEQKNGTPAELQFLVHATVIVNSKEFSGAGFSDGDHYIKQVADKKLPPGNSTTWINAGVNHHIAVTLGQLRKIQHND